MARGCLLLASSILLSLQHLTWVKGVSASGEAAVEIFARPPRQGSPANSITLAVLETD
jgi:hypothetical protein